jgi:hypothetical protein
MTLRHLQRADVSRARVSELVRPDRCVASALPAVRRIRTDASGSTHPWPNLCQVASARTACVSSLGHPGPPASDLEIVGQSH